MTNTTPGRGTTPACPMPDTFPTRGDTSPEAVRARVAEFAEWFGVEPVKVKARMGQVYLVDELIAWCRDEGASLDWILLGEPKGMAAAFRTIHSRTPEQRELLAAISLLSRPAQAAFVKALEDFAAGRITLQDFERRMREHETEGAAAV